MSDADDGRLLQAYVADGDQEAFAELVNRYARLVHGVCREVLGDSVNADDAVQETFLALMRRAPELHHDTPLAGWLRVTATSCARQLRRSLSRRLRREGRAAGQQPAVSEDPLPVAADERPVISSALQELPPEQRAALLLRYVDEHSEAEAARIAGCPQRTLHNRVMAGLSKLRWQLRERGLEVSQTALVAMLATAQHGGGPPLAPVALSAGHGLRLTALAKGVLIASVLGGVAATSLVIVYQRLPPAPATPVVALVEPATTLAPRAAGAVPPPPAGVADPNPQARRYGGAHSELTALSFSADGQLLATGYDRTLLCWQPPALAPISIQALPGAGVRALALAPSGAWAALGNEDGMVRTWDCTHGRLLQTLRGHHDAVTAVSISPDGSHLASTAKDGLLLIWDVATGALEHTCQGGPGWVSAVAWSPDGRTLASVGDDGACSLWDAGSGQLQRVLHGHFSSLRAVVWSPDGAWVASAGGDAKVCLWNSRSGALMQTLPTTMNMLMALAITSDGTLLAACDRGGGCWLWSLPSGQLRRHLVDADVHFNALGFTPDGAQLAVTGTDAVVRTWRTSELLH